jgi:hypothetical protein
VPSLAKKRPTEELFFASEDPALARQLQRRAEKGELLRIAAGTYVLDGDPAEVASRVQRNWQVLAGHLVKGAVVSHISAFEKGVTPGGYLTLSHPTQFNKTINLPGLSLVLLKGPSQLPGDLPMGASGIFWASRPRALLENLGRVIKRRPTRAGREAVEERLVSILNASKEAGLNRLRDEARALAPMLDAEAAFQELDATVGALLKTHSKGELKTKLGHLVANGAPADSERLYRFEALATALRSKVLPTIPDVASAGAAKIHFAFIESYFSNYVEGTKFSIEEAEGIVLRNQLVMSRPKDSHDVLGVFNQAIKAGSRDSLPPPGEPFVNGLQQRHHAMLSRRPEAHPGELKMEENYAGTTKFVEPAFVRGTLQTGSQIALTVPEGMARAIFYAFLVSEVHPFDDGNGRLSRLTMNAELSRLGLCRIIIPTLYHPQYVDCQRALTQANETEGFISALTKAANWSAQFEYLDLQSLIATLKGCNAFEESPARFRLLNSDGSRAA